MRKQRSRLGLAVVAGFGVSLCAASAGAEEIKLRAASGHAAVQSYVHLMSTFMLPEIKKRVEAKTLHKIDFIEGYGGSVVKPMDVMEGVQSGIVDIGAWAYPFEPSNLPLHSFQAMVPFGTMVARDSVRIARAVYDKVPFMQKVLEDKFNQKLIGLVGDNGYNLMTTFDWKNLADLKGKKIAGAGINLKWLEYAGVIPVQFTAPEGYSGMQTGVYQGALIFPSIPANLKWHEVAKHYTLIGFGSITWQTVTMNKAKFSKLPKEVQEIIVEVGREYEALTAKVSDEEYEKHLDTMRKGGAAIKSLPESVRLEWAKSLEKFPQEKADELNAKGMPATEVFRMVITEAEKLGYKWPVRYEIK
jgi:C4-dicarboxylate-binding protein DctP